MNKSILLVEKRPRDNCQKWVFRGDGWASQGTQSSKQLDVATCTYSLIRMATTRAIPRPRCVEDLQGQYRDGSMGVLRKLITIALLAVFGLPFASSLFALTPKSEANLPACSRQD